MKLDARQLFDWEETENDYHYPPGKIFVWEDSVEHGMQQLYDLEEIWNAGDHVAWGWMELGIQQRSA